MRKLLLFFFLSILFTKANTQILSESFDNVTFPPSGWTNTLVSAGDGSGSGIPGDVWTRVTASTNPTASPHSGAGMAFYNSYDFDPESKADLITPALNFSGVGKRVSFWMYRSALFTNGDSIVVYVNTSPSGTGATFLGKVIRYIASAPAVASVGWYQYTFNIPAAFNGATNHIIFRACGEYGLNMLIDDVIVEDIPSCLPPSMITNNPIGNTTASHSWSAVSGATGYQWAVTTSATPPASGTATTATTASSTGLTPVTQYYLHVRSACGAAFSSWATTTFTTSFDCTTAINITACGAVQNAVIAAGSGVYDITDCGFNTPGLEKLYTFTPTVSGLYTLNITSVMGTGYIDYFYKAASGGCAPSGWTCIDDNSAVGTDVFGPLTAGTTYYILLDLESATGGANQTFQLDCPASAPPNCVTNIAPANTTTNISAPPTLNWNAATGATGYNVFFGTANPPISNIGNTANTSVSVTGTIPGTTYYWYVQPTNTAGGATGCNVNTTSFTMANAPANDEACNAITLTLNGPSDCKNTTNASSISDPVLPNSCSTPNNTIWYKFTPTTNGAVILKTQIPATPADPLSGWAVWYTATGTCPSALTFTPVSTNCQQFGGTNGDINNLVSPVLTAGTTYYIMIDGVAGDIGEGCFSIEALPAPPTTCATNTAPANAATGVTPNPFVNFAWNAVTDATSYTIFISSTNNPPNRATDSITTVTTTNVNIVALAGNTTYYWYVIPKNSGGEGPNCVTSAQTTSFTTANAPANDNCSGAVPITVGTGFCTTPVTGTLLLASASIGAPARTCATGGSNTDVWYSVVVPSGQFVIVQTSAVTDAATAGNDMILQAVHSSNNTCTGTLSEKTCDDDGNPESGVSGSHSRLTIANPGPSDSTYFLRVFAYNNDDIHDFAICAWNGAVTPPIATGTNCINGSVNIDSARKFMWVSLRDATGNIIAEVYPNGNKMGNTSYSYFLNSGAVRTDANGIKYLDRNITITPTTQPATTVDVRLYYKSTELDALQLVDAAVTSANINVTKTTNTCATSSNTIEPGALLTHFDDDLYNVTDSFVTVTTPSFSTFFLHGGSIALPVSFSDIRGAITGSTNTIYWTTATEYNNQKFVIERSTDGSNFINIGDVATRAVNGNSSTALSYNFVDAVPYMGKAFYRLQMVETSGRTNYSQIITLRRGQGKIEIVDVRPNPTTGMLYFNVLGTSNRINIIVRDLSGKQVLSKSFIQNGNFSIDINTVSSGMYILEAIDTKTNDKALFKIMKQ
jgi:Secretion system C-terminal sorting domain